MPPRDPKGVPVTSLLNGRFVLLSNRKDHHAERDVGWTGYAMVNGEPKFLIFTPHEMGRAIARAAKERQDKPRYRPSPSFVRMIVRKCFRR